MRPTQWDIASASQCKQASAAALDNCFRRSSISSAFRCRSWSDSLMLESVWEVFGNHQGTRSSKKEPSISSAFSISIPPECSNKSWTTQWDIASASQCKQASAAALDNCFRRSSTSSAFRCRSCSDSLMLQSVWEVFGNHQGTRSSKKEPSISSESSAFSISYLHPQSVATNLEPLCATSMSLYLPSSSLPCSTSNTMRHCKCKPVQASFGSRLGQLFSETCNFFRVLLPLLVWLLNAWVSWGSVRESPGNVVIKERAKHI